MENRIWFYLFPFDDTLPFCSSIYKIYPLLFSLFVLIFILSFIRLFSLNQF